MDYRIRFTFLAFAVAYGLGLTTELHAETLTWTGAVDAEFYNEANWENASSVIPADGTIDHSSEANADLVIGSGTAVVNAAGFAQPIHLGTGSLTITGGTLDMLGEAGANGIKMDAAGGATAPVMMSGDSVAELQFILDIDMTLSGNAQVILGGGGDPVNRSTINLTSSGSSVSFLAETVDAFINEHLGKFSVGGNPAVLDENLMVLSDGGNGSVVTAVPEPSTLAGLLIGLALLAFRGSSKLKA